MNYSQSWTCFPGTYMLIFLPRRCIIIVLVNLLEIVIILIHYQSSYNISHTMKPSDLLLLAVVALRCGMYPAGKVDISQHVAIPR